MTGDEKQLIHCFQDSLSGSAWKWYVKLDRSLIYYFARFGSFLYGTIQACGRHGSSMSWIELSLQNIEKKSTESFKEYAQRWRDLAAQVPPPLTEKEITVMFVNTLLTPVKLFGSATKFRIW